MRLLAMCAVGLLSVACSRSSSDTSSDALPAASASSQPARAKFAVAISADQEVRARTLEAQLSNGKPLTSDQRRDQDNYPLFVFLAAQSDDEFVLMQTLSAMKDCTPDKAKRPRATAEVVDYYLGSKKPRVVGAALDAAQPWLGRNPDNRVLKSTLAILDEKAVASDLAVAVFGALEWVPAFSLTPEVFQRASELLSDAKAPPAFVAGTLSFLLSSRSALDKVELPKALFESKEPGVRALAARALAGKLGHEAVPRLTELLEDDSPAVRTAAAWSLGEVGDAKSIEALAQLIDDDASAKVNVGGAESVLGLPYEVSASQPTRPTPGVAAMLSIEKLSGGALKLQPFVGDMAIATRKNRASVRAYLDNQRG